MLTITSEGDNINLTPNATKTYGTISTQLHNLIGSNPPPEGEIDWNVGPVSNF